MSRCEIEKMNLSSVLAEISCSEFGKVDFRVFIREASFPSNRREN